MATTAVETIRNVALAGQTGSGKTTLAEALFAAATPGRGERRTGLCDHDPIEKDFGHSLKTALLNFEWEDTRIYLADTPGMPDFSGQAIAGLEAADTALIVIDAQSGVQMMTERMMELAGRRGLCRILVINKIDADNVDLPALVRDLRDRFGRQCLLLDLPAHHGADVIEVLEHASGEADFDSVAEAHRALIDQVVEEDETLLARYLEEGAEPSVSELHAPFERALREGRLVPIVFVSARTGGGLRELLHILAALAPNPAEGNPPPFYRGDPGMPDVEPFQARADASAHVVAHVFRVNIDPYMGRVGMFRVYQGTVRRDAQLFVGDAKRAFRVAHLYRVNGPELQETDALIPGEIGAVAKVEEIVFDAVLHDSHEEDHIHLKAAEFPPPMHGLAIQPKRKGDEQKLSEVLGRLVAEDPSFVVERDAEGHEWVIRGLGELHLKAKLDTMARQYKVEVETRPPRIPYRETITRPAEGHHRHKKQSGGAGQFGEVHLRIEPRERGAGFEFIDSVKGGAIPGVFMPAVQKGVLQALGDGVAAGFPVVDLKVTVYDGKTHPVDGKEVAFIAAGRKAVMAAIEAAAPIVLEPIVELEALIPESAIGEVTGDLSSRRGHVTATQPRGPGLAGVKAIVPLGEITGYSSRIKAMTGGAGSFTFAFAHYSPVPPTLQRELVASHRPKADED